MVRFVWIELYDETCDDYIERWFNVDYIRHIEPDKNKVMLNGSYSAIIISSRSMAKLMSEIGYDVHNEHSAYPMVVRKPWWKRIFIKIWKK